MKLTVEFPMAGTYTVGANFTMRGDNGIYDVKQFDVMVQYAGTYEVDLTTKMIREVATTAEVNRKTDLQSMKNDQDKLINDLQSGLRKNAVTNNRIDQLYKTALENANAFGTDSIYVELETYGGRVPRVEWIGDTPDIATDECNHKWKSYTGLAQQFEYCEVCDKKKGL